MSAPDKRPYLSSDQRRADLLDVASRLVVAGGWAALTMKGLAAEARVSRQLVYQHFADLPELLVAVTERLFEGMREAMQLVVARGQDDDVADVARRTYELYLELPREQRRVLRAISAEPEIDSEALRRVRRHVRAEIIALWTTDVRRRTGLPPARARALAWALNNAAWGLADLVDDGEIALPHARELLGDVAARALQPPLAGGTPKPRRTTTRNRVNPASSSAHRRAGTTKGSVT